MGHDLHATACALVAEGKGVLAIDESVGTITKRFEALGIESTGDSRRDYRELLLTTAGLADHISGAILFDETFRQTTSDGTPLPVVMERAGILPGIKVDTGAKPLAGFPGEMVTEGLDGLRERVAEYVGMGAKFAKWRAVITIGDGIPSRGCLVANAHALARYAALCQEGGLVPIVEPEVLMDGDHSIERCQEVTELTLRLVFAELAEQCVGLEGIVLKPSMVVPGKKAARQAGVEEVAQASVTTYRRTVPPAVPGIALLSGGQSAELATQHLQAMNQLGPLPWQLTFSYGRALQDPSISTWRGDVANLGKAQAALAHRARCNGAAHRGAYDESMEKDAALAGV